MHACHASRGAGPHGALKRVTRAGCAACLLPRGLRSLSCARHGPTLAYMRIYKALASSLSVWGSDLCTCGSEHDTHYSIPSWTHFTNAHELARTHVLAKSNRLTVNNLTARRNWWPWTCVCAHWWPAGPPSARMSCSPRWHLQAGGARSRPRAALPARCQPLACPRCRVRLRRLRAAHQSVSRPVCQAA